MKKKVVKKKKKLSDAEKIGVLAQGVDHLAARVAELESALVRHKHVPADSVVVLRDQPVAEPGK